MERDEWAAMRDVEVIDSPRMSGARATNSTAEMAEETAPPSI